MQQDFHYYATYCAAYLAGYSHEDCMDICYSAQFVDACSRTLLSKIGGPSEAATTQLSLEMMDARTDLLGLADVTRIWSSFHFLPYDLKAECRGGKRYKDKYRLICNANGPLVVDTVNLARGGDCQSVGVAMHVLADTWAHRYFAGTPSLVINNTNDYFYEILDDEGKEIRPITFKHSPVLKDDVDNCIYANSLYQPNENTIMNLGHGRAGHLPDYSFIRYKYLPAWGDYEEIIKDNPKDYRMAFMQMIFAMKYLRGEVDEFVCERYDEEAIAPYEDRLHAILTKRQPLASEDWKAFGEELSGHTIDPYSDDTYQQAYIDASPEEKDNTFLGRFIRAAIAQKDMVSHKIFESGNKLAGRIKKG